MPQATVNGTTLTYSDDGPRDAPVLLFSHSLFFDSAMFHQQVADFRDRYRVICYDHRGQGASSRASLEQLDMDTLADDASALLEHLDAGPAHVLGNSMGGFIALRLAARRPDLVLSAVVMGSSAEAEGKIAEFDPLVSAMREQGTEPVIDTLMWIMFGDDILADPERADVTGHWRTKMLGLDRGIADCAYQVVHRSPVLDELSSCTVPILAIIGEQDHAYSIANNEAIITAVKDGRLVVIPGAGHSIALEQPGPVNAAIKQHLAAASG